MNTFTMSMISKLLAPLSGNTFVGVTALTVPSLSGGKKNPHLGRITKRSILTIQVFKDGTKGYINKRQKELDAKGDGEIFKISDRAWGQRLSGTPFFTHTKANGEYAEYIEGIVTSVTSVQWLLDGNPIDKGDVEGVKPSTDEGFAYRNWKLASLEELRAFGEEVTA
jgi:hypothetical protein